MDLQGFKKALNAVRKFLVTQQQLDAKVAEAVKANDIEKTKKALADGGKPDAQIGWQHETPLTIAIAARNTGMIKTLLDAGADPNVQLGYYNASPFMAAVKTNDTAIVTQLLDAKADVNLRGEGGNTALALAVMAKNAPLFDLLLEKGAAADAPNNKGWTPLFYAAWANDTAAVEKLLAKGARTDRRDEDGRDVLRIARKYDSVKAYDAIQAHIDAQVPEWQPNGEKEIARVSIRRALGYRLTDIFNFGTNERTLITHNFKTGTDTVVRSEIGEAADKAAVAQARAQLPAPKPAAQA